MVLTAFMPYEAPCGPCGISGFLTVIQHRLQPRPRIWAANHTHSPPARVAPQNVPPSQLFPVERGASQLLHLLAGLGQQDNGRYMAWDQQDIPW